MKPVDLTMSAFGPYSKETYINFEFLSSEGVFLITGDTGAGKSTIFDAISFALYGEGSGGKERRNARSFRSDYADAKTETFVRFRFTHRMRTYEITRNPEYERDKVVGKGKTRQGARATMKIEETGEIIDGVSAVDEAVMNLISLSREQFAQTVMIAQGDFLRILNAKSDDRKKLFQKIFNTNTYAQLQLRLKDMYARSKAEVDRLNDRVMNAVDRIQATGAWTETFSGFRKSPEGVSNVISALKEYLDETKAQIEKDQTEIDALDENAGKIIKKLSEERALSQDFDEREALIKALALHDEKKADVLHMESRVKRAMGAMRVQPYLALYENAERLFKDSVKKHDEAAENQEKYRPLLEKIENELDKARKNYDGNYLKIRTRADALQKALPVMEKYRAAEAKLTIVLSQLERALKEESRAHAEYADARSRFYLGQAALIAKTLADGEPCPVCGSVSHPLPAKETENAVTQKALEDAEKAYNAASRLSREREKDAAVLKTDVNAAKEQLKNASLQESDTIESMNKQITDLNSQADALDKAVRELTARAEKGRKYLTEAAAVFNQTLEAIKKHKEEAENGKKALNEQILSEGFSSLEDFSAARTGAGELKRLEDEIRQYGEKRIKIESRLSALGEKLQSRQRPDMEKTERELKALQDDLREKRRLHVEADKRVSANEEALNSLMSIRKQLQAEQEKWALISDVYASVSGQQSGKMKLSFETYVQQYYFKQVISAANKRLTALTEGMFTLRVKQEAANMRSQAGLDLEVLDRSTGLWRDVSTLSGGESFMASLALALGLSDVVQAGSGGIRLDAMFIDEGFGSLDENALRQALTLLTRLADGKRLIGVISHMPELKERITKRIVVSKKTFGSVARVEEG